MNLDIMNSTAFKLHQATLLVDRIADDYLQREHGLRYAPFLVLLMARIMGPTSQQAIAGRLDVSRASITQRVSALVADGLLEVTKDPDDSRANVVRLTKSGASKVAAAWSGLESHKSGLDEGVDEAMLQAQLDIIISNGKRVFA
jgi:DNA-binding MarR family transcriptional regulator